MTFKHVKFEDSVTMRSLERVAREKGWINNTPLSKVASFDNKDLSVSINLTENIIKLCNGLREYGLELYANEVEQKFIDYKKAQTLYETSKENGNNLIDAAHPKGSHKLDNIDGDSIIETIVDQHLAHIKVIEKKPTGKLTSSSDIINSVKMVLAQRLPPPNPNLLSMLSNLVIELADKLDSIIAKANITNKLREAEIKQYIRFIRDISLNPSSNNIVRIISTIQLIRKTLRKELMNNQDLWRTIDALFPAIQNIIIRIKLVRNNLDNPLQVKKTESPPQVLVENARPPTEEDILLKNLTSANTTLKKFQIAISTNPDITESEKNKANEWIAQKMEQVNGIKSQLDNLASSEKIENIPVLLSNLNKITIPFDAFAKVWID